MQKKKKNLIGVLVPGCQILSTTANAMKLNHLPALLSSDGRRAEQPRQWIALSSGRIYPALLLEKEEAGL